MKANLYSVGRTLSWVMLLQVLIITQMASVSAVPETIIEVEPETNTADVGETFTVNVKLTDVQNLFGLEVTLHWDPSILQVDGVDVRLGVESHPDGVLHEPVYRMKNETIAEEGKYQLVATSTDRETPAFSGSGNVVKISFEVIDIGSCELNLETELADKPPYGGVSSPIAHTAVDGSFNLEAPEEPLIWLYITITVVVGIVAVGTATAIYRSKKQKRQSRRKEL